MQTHTQTHTHTQTDTHRHRQTHTDTDRHRQTHTDTDTHTPVVMKVTFWAPKFTCMALLFSMNAPLALALEEDEGGL